MLIENYAAVRQPANNALVRVDPKRAVVRLAHLENY